MGYWGIEPWANDQGADWYRELFAGTMLAQKLNETLLEPIEMNESNLDEIRAAVSLFVLIGRPLMYPREFYHVHLDLSIKRLNELRAYWAEKGEKNFADWSEKELEVLDRRRNRHPDQSSPPEELSEWWTNWM